ncbi:hypothetical protein Scep_001542 [Stephania cephalantha]|uniref:Uncharacterized protein n=1 Tax=Stephania cephalantha TaxID=152367 RepID=A0AAP0L8L3_9MAGN
METLDLPRDSCGTRIEKTHIYPQTTTELPYLSKSKMGVFSRSPSTRVHRPHCGLFSTAVPSSPSSSPLLHLFSLV